MVDNDHVAADSNNCSGGLFAGKLLHGLPIPPPTAEPIMGHPYDNLRQRVPGVRFHTSGDRVLSRERRNT